ncbi:MAG: hypothetical protein IJA11_06945 [Oscillospiraceae bacterium]|nr:hypothetical protein [Oscillospiraceae bacterium]
MGSKQSKIRNYRIYALYNPSKRIAFVGKSYAKNLAPMYSKHLCGKNIYTNEHFGKTLPLVAPKLSILEDVKGTYREAYHHLVAWVRVFLDADYTMIMQEGTVFYANSLHPTSQAIYNSIRTISLDVVLQQGLYQPMASPQISHPPSKIERKCKSVQFNLRVFEEDMLNFIHFCEEQGLSRKEAFSLLLGNCSLANNSYAHKEIERLKDRLAAQTTDLQTTQDKLARLSASVRNDFRYQSLFSVTQSLLREYCEVMHLGSEVQPFRKLKIGPYHSFPNISQYPYPESETGTQTIILNGLVYGKGRSPATFVLARSEKNNCRLKFRVYPKKDYIGIRIPKSAWMYQGAKWLVSWQRANDGAIELCASLPLPLSLDTLVPDDYPPLPPIAEKKTSLDEIIRHANEKKHFS